MSTNIQMKIGVVNMLTRTVSGVRIEQGNPQFQKGTLWAFPLHASV
jgi:hypothetical protein